MTAHRWPARAIVAVIRFYRMAISPLRPACCRYTPTCSQYALEAVEQYGAARGAWLALRRLLRCHPFHAGGHDPVPPRVLQTDRPTRPETDLLVPRRRPVRRTA